MLQVFALKKNLKPKRWVIKINKNSNLSLNVKENKRDQLQKKSQNDDPEKVFLQQGKRLLKQVMHTEN